MLILITQIYLNLFMIGTFFLSRTVVFFITNHHLIKSWSGCLLSLMKEFIGRGFSSDMWLTNVFALGPIRFLAGGVGKAGTAELEGCLNTLLGVVLLDDAAVVLHLKMLWTYQRFYHFNNNFPLKFILLNLPFHQDFPVYSLKFWLGFSNVHN
jgi:hypothetical protein